MGNIGCGYRLAADGMHVEPNTAEQIVVAEIRRLRNDGQSLRKIAAAMNGHGNRTRRGTDWRL